jgi:hypothetical protein
MHEGCEKIKRIGGGEGEEGPKRKRFKEKGGEGG